MIPLLELYMKQTSDILSVIVLFFYLLFYIMSSRSSNPFIFSYPREICPLKSESISNLPLISREVFIIRFVSNL